MTWVSLVSDCTCDCLTLALRGCQCGEGLPARLPPIGTGDEYQVKDASGEVQMATYDGAEWLSLDGMVIDAIAIKTSGAYRAF